jgi:hypothetical protein
MVERLLKHHNLELNRMVWFHSTCLNALELVSHAMSLSHGTYKVIEERMHWSSMNVGVHLRRIKPACRKGEGCFIHCAELVLCVACSLLSLGLPAAATMGERR